MLSFPMISFWEGDMNMLPFTLPHLYPIPPGAILPYPRPPHRSFDDTLERERAVSQLRFFKPRFQSVERELIFRYD